MQEAVADMLPLRLPAKACQQLVKHVSSL